MTDLCKTKTETLQLQETDSYPMAESIFIWSLTIVISCFAVMVAGLAIKLMFLLTKDAIYEIKSWRKK